MATFLSVQNVALCGLHSYSFKEVQPQCVLVSLENPTTDFDACVYKEMHENKVLNEWSKP